MTDSIDLALQQLAAFAAGSWSNHDIVKQVHAVRALRKAEMAEAAAQSAHVLAMYREVCAAVRVTPGAMAGLAVDKF